MIDIVNRKFINELTKQYLVFTKSIRVVAVCLIYNKKVAIVKSGYLKQNYEACHKGFHIYKFLFNSALHRDRLYACW